MKYEWECPIMKTKIKELEVGDVIVIDGEPYHCVLVAKNRKRKLYLKCVRYEGKCDEEGFIIKVKKTVIKNRSLEFLKGKSFFTIGVWTNKNKGGDGR